MKIIADDKIPHLDESFGQYGQLVSVPGDSISPQMLQDATILLTRSITTVNTSLLKNTTVQFVGTMTAGIDHLDTTWLETAGIYWADAKGANANAVAQYVLACLAYLQTKGIVTQNKPRIGIIGVGHVGNRVNSYLKEIDADIVLNDPPRAEKENGFSSTPLSDWRDLDLITIHTPYNRDGRHPTHHLINKDFLAQQKPGCVILNTSRGAVVDTQALAQTNDLVACLDVFENEPAINQKIIEHCTLATPHIAGYSLQAKFNATHIVFSKACEYFGWKQPLLHLSENEQPSLSFKNKNWRQNVLTIYNPQDDDQQMRQVLAANDADIATAFERLRRNYALRQEWL